jgi:methylated-DNA-protein-cysteine methyltransferase-like protein
MSNSFYDAVYRVVRLIPPGRVATYGQIAAILGSPRAARAVGYALFNLRETPEHADVPWQRVINAQGGISSRGDVVRAELQMRLLRAEGVVLRADDTVDLVEYRWEGPPLFISSPGED